MNFKKMVFLKKQSFENVKKILEKFEKFAYNRSNKVKTVN